MNLMNRRGADTQREVTERGSVSRSAWDWSELLRVTDPRSDTEQSLQILFALRLCASAV